MRSSTFQDVLERNLRLNEIAHFEGKRILNYYIIRYLSFCSSVLLEDKINQAEEKGNKLKNMVMKVKKDLSQARKQVIPLPKSQKFRQKFPDKSNDDRCYPTKILHLLTLAVFRKKGRKPKEKSVGQDFSKYDCRASYS